MVDITLDVRPDGSGYVQGMLQDGEGRVCLALDSTLALYDADGSPLGQIDLGTTDGWIQSMVRGGDGAVYFSFYDYSSGSGKLQLRKVDFDAKNADAKYENFPSDANDVTAGLDETTLLVSTSDSVYQYDMAAQTSEKLFDWLDCDIYGSYINSVGTLADGRLAAVLNDWETDENELAVLTRTEASQVAQKTQIVIGSLYSDSSLASQIVKFNKASEQYHITLRSYVDYSNVETSEDYQTARNDALTRLNNEITSADCPDMLLLDSLDVEQLASKGVFEDLTPYLESSSVLSKEDFFENILQTYTYQDQLIAIPKDFVLATLAGKTSEVGEEPGWTLDELMAYAEEHPDAQIFDYNYTTRSYLLEYLISYNQSKYIDWDTGTCSFDQEEFIKVLEFASRFPAEYSYDEESTPAKLASGKVLLYNMSIYEPGDLQQAEAMFGEPITYIGFPNEDGETGTYLQCYYPIAISAKSENQDAAWTFLESYLTTESDWYSFGFSSRKEKFEEQLAESQTTDNVDENGDPILNEEGYALTGGGIGYEDWEYYYRVTTDEEAELLREMVETAQPSGGMDEEILSIVTEEAESYFSGDKSAEDAAAVIQSRVQIYVNEQK